MFANDILTEDLQRRSREGDQRYIKRCREHGKPLLHPSKLWFCNRQAYYAMLWPFPEHPQHVEKTHPPDDYVLSLFDSGNRWEQLDAEAFVAAGGQHKVPLVHEPWGAEVDFLFDDPPRIIEYKDTSEANFYSRDRLPYEFHCVQLVVYGRLYERIHGHTPACHLYYRARGDRWAEFVVWQSGPIINYEGKIKGDWTSGLLEFDTDLEMQVQEGYWLAGEVPPAYPTPYERYDFGGCIKNYKGTNYINCDYWGHCWPDVAVKGRRLL